MGVTTVNGGSAMINPMHLRTFLTVARHGSFASAARHLGYTASAVSQQIAALERDHRLQLFHREARGIVLTAAGRDMVQRAEPVVSTLTAFEDDEHARRQGLAGRVRVGSFPTASRRLLPTAIARLSAEHADIEIRLDEGEPDPLLTDLTMRELDVVIAYEYDLVPRHWPSGAIVTPLLREDLVLVLSKSHPLCGRDISFADLAEQVWVSTREGTSGALALQRVCGSVGVIPDVRFRSNDYEVVAAFVRAGLGIALVPALAHAPSPGIGTARIVDLTVKRHVSAVTLGPRSTSARTQVLEALAHGAHDAARMTSGVHAAYRRQQL